MSLRNIMRNKSLKSVSILALGTGLSQILMILVVPILTRLYTPDDFDFFASFAATMTILTTIACLRFEIAIPLPKSLNASKSLLVISFVILSLITLLIFFCIILIDKFFPDINNLEFHLYYLLPVGVLFGSLYACLQYWHIKASRFGLISKARISQSTTGAIVQVLLGYLAFGKLGLILGYVLNSCLGMSLFIKRFIKEDYSKLSPLKALSLKRWFIVYKDYPTYSTMEALFNVLGTQLPIIIIAAYSIGPEAGFLALATRIMIAPLSLIGSSVSQVFMSDAPNKFRNNLLANYITNVSCKLIMVGVFPLIFVSFYSIDIFTFMFGDEWVRTGEIVAYMTPWLIFQFIASPLSLSLNIVGKIRFSSVLNFLGFILRVGVVFFVAQVHVDYVVEVYCIMSLAFYMIFYSATLYYCNVRGKNLMKIFTIFIYCVLISIAFLFIVDYILIASGISNL